MSKIIPCHSIKGPTVPYICLNDWPESNDESVFFAQCGSCPSLTLESGKVIDEMHFFECFPRNPNSYIRAESKVSLADAEQKCWELYQRFVNCGEHDWDRRGREDHCAYCSKCGSFGSGVVVPLHNCDTCGKPTTAHQGEVSGKYWCSEHFKDMPLSDWPDYKWEHTRLEYLNSMWRLGRKDEVNL